MTRILFVVSFALVCLFLWMATTYQPEPKVLFWRDGKPIYKLEDPAEFGATSIEFDPKDGSRTAYYWDGEKNVKLWRRR